MNFELNLHLVLIRNWDPATCSKTKEQQNKFYLLFQEFSNVNVGSIFLESVDFFQAYEIYCSKQVSVWTLLRSQTSFLGLSAVRLDLWVYCTETVAVTVNYSERRRKNATAPGHERAKRPNARTISASNFYSLLTNYHTFLSLSVLRIHRYITHRWEKLCRTSCVSLTISFTLNNFENLWIIIILPNVATVKTQANTNKQLIRFCVIWAQ